MLLISVQPVSLAKEKIMYGLRPKLQVLGKNNYELGAKS